MPSPPELFEDDDFSDGSDRPTAESSASDEIDHEHKPSGRSPNYFFRRAVVIGGVVAVAGTAAIVVTQLMGTGGTTTTSGAVSAEWNSVVLIDEQTGRVIVDDDAGEEQARVESGVRSVAATGVVDATALIVGAERVAIVDLDAETSESFDISAETVVRPSGSALTMIAPATTGARGILVHGPTGDRIDTDEFVPIGGARYEFASARSDPTGRTILVTDSGNFQSVLFDFDSEEPSYFPGLALAVDADIAVTAQNVGNDATVSVFDHTGDQIASGRTPSVRAAMVNDDVVRLVTIDGEVIAMSSITGDTETSGQLDIGTVSSGYVATSGDRLVVSGLAGTAVIDDTGAIIGTYPDQVLPTADWARLGASCVTVLDSTTPTEPNAAVVSLIDGSTVVEGAVGADVFASADGCLLMTATPTGYTVFSAAAIERVESDATVVGLSPDGEAVVVTLDGRLALSALDQSDDPIDLGPASRSVAFADR